MSGHNFFRESIPDGYPCEKCGKYPASSKWAGDQNFTDLNHGGTVDWWCEGCMLRAQMDYAEQESARMQERIPGYRQRLFEFEATTPPLTPDGGSMKARGGAG